MSEKSKDQATKAGQGRPEREKPFLSYGSLSLQPMDLYGPEVEGGLQGLKS